MVKTLALLVRTSSSLCEASISEGLVDSIRDAEHVAQLLRATLGSTLGGEHVRGGDPSVWGGRVAQGRPGSRLRTYDLCLCIQRNSIGLLINLLSPIERGNQQHQ